MHLYDNRQSFVACGQADGSVKVAAGSTGGRLYAYSSEVIYRWKTCPGRRIASHVVDAAITRHAAEEGFKVSAIRRAGLSEELAPMKPHQKTSRQTREAEQYMKSLFSESE